MSQKGGIVLQLSTSVIISENSVIISVTLWCHPSHEGMTHSFLSHRDRKMQEPADLILSTCIFISWGFYIFICFFLSAWQIWVCFFIFRTFLAGFNIWVLSFSSPPTLFLADNLQPILSNPMKVRHCHQFTKQNFEERLLWSANYTIWYPLNIFENIV